VYVPESDRGPLHAKNVDDPLDTWTPLPPIAEPGPWPHSPLFFDGVGNGLHIDDIPPEIFPADGLELCERHCTTVDEATEFLARYNYFWANANLLIHDAAGHSVAIDKASRCRLAIRKPDASGISYVNGMSSFDPEEEAFIEGQRQRFLNEVGQDENGIDATYSRLCEAVLRNMKRHMAELARRPTLDGVFAWMNCHDEDGPMCKTGVPHHPEFDMGEATLLQRVFFLDEKVLWRRQWRGETPVWEDKWEVVKYE
jgi:hypothetical protein